MSWASRNLAKRVSGHQERAALATAAALALQFQISLSISTDSSESSSGGIAIAPAFSLSPAGRLPNAFCIVCAIRCELWGATSGEYARLIRSSIYRPSARGAGKKAPSKDGEGRSWLQ
jgi:hypothetical protein